MKKDLYVYNESTLSYEKLQHPLKRNILRNSVLLLVCLATVTTGFLINNGIIEGPKEKFLERELSQIETQYTAINNDFDVIADELQKVQIKDAEVHRMIFGMEPIDSSVWEGGIGGHDKYQYITPYGNSTEIIEESLTKVEKLKRQLDIQKKSLDTLFLKAVERESKLASVPSIKPIEEDKLKRKIKHLSGFGYRIHPVHKVKKFHKGIDFTCPSGTAIQATGNGKVIKVKKKRSGYGNHIVIDHGYGFETLYAHLSKVDVKVGDKVVKGQKIGSVGSTGTSTAPHLHYEVHVNGKAVNPIDYCMDGLSTDEYHELLEKSSIENQSFD